MDLDLQLEGQWAELERLLPGFDERISKAYRKALLGEAQILRGKMVEGFTAQAGGGVRPWAPLKETTLAMRRFFGFRGTKALIRGGDLMGAIRVVPKADAIFIGILRSAKSKDGRILVNVGIIHEVGGEWTIRTTPRMMRFLAMVFRKQGVAPSGRPKGDGTIRIKIPPRPFVAPVLEAIVPGQLERSIGERVANDMQGQIGRP